ncbi:anhydro-N-acetylmuramic acid kinase [Roseomonas elaeocarpi]|uniref:Anhydro-N-acetylmuramic acid kinase n=1 Tax=Roseomonas elaeocarpi TaxID=907779 RepID=A0ABV6JPF8_9PROT
MIVIGLMSGTSVDAIDAAAAEFLWRRTEIVLRPLGHAEFPWPDGTRARLLDALPPAGTSMAEVCALDTLAGEAFGAAADRAVRELAGGRADLVVSHGQTVFHWIEGGRARGTLQIGQPAAIVEATGLPVISDIRARDVAAGGQGAPLASTLDALWLAGTDGRRRAALNLGGIANITVVGRAGEPVLGFDTGPANCLLDVEAARLSNGQRNSDTDGALALSGTVRPDLLARLLEDAYYSQPAPKSTGRELFHTDYTRERLRGLPPASGPDLMATLTELTARTVAAACAAHGVVEVVASGGGTRNPALMAALRRNLAPAVLLTSEERGLPTDGKEAYLMALLGFLSWHAVPGVAPGATGSRTPRVLGRISPGDAPLRLPDPAPAPTALVIEPAGPSALPAADGPGPSPADYPPAATPDLPSDRA